MPEMSGLDFIRTFKSPPEIIITTAYPDYALEGFELNVVDYLLKPFTFERFTASINKLRQNYLVNEEISDEKKVLPFILIHSEHKIHRVYFENIRYVESKREYVVFNLFDGRKILALNSLKKLEELLPKDQFARVHRSYIVGINSVDCLSGKNIHMGEDKIPVGAVYRDNVINRIFSI